MKHIHIIILIAFFAVQKNMSFAISIDQAVAIAINNHPVASAIPFSEKQPVELEPLQLRYWHAGSFAGTNNIFTATQNFGSVPEHYRRSQHHRRAINTQQAKQILTVEELAWKVKAAYMDVVYYRQRLEIMQEHAPRFEVLIDIAEARMLADSMPELTRISIGARYAAYISSLYIANEEAKRAELSLKRIMNIPDEQIDISQKILNMYQIHPHKPFNERFTPIKHQALYDAQIAEAQSVIQLEKSRLFPSIHAGYIYQSIEGTGQHQGFMLGVSIPVWAQRARIRQAQIDLATRENETQYSQFADTQHVEILKSLLNEYFILISYSRENTLVEAELIYEEIENDFLSGRITDFAATFTKLHDAINKELKHLEYISLYNHAALELEFFTQ